MKWEKFKIFKEQWIKKVNMIENKEIKDKKIISYFDFIANKIIEICYCQYRSKNSKAKNNLDIKSNY